MVANLLSLEAQDGNGGSARDMAYGIFHFKVNNSQLTQMQQMSSYHNLVEEESLSVDQIFNCDETGLYY